VPLAVIHHRQSSRFAGGISRIVRRHIHVESSSASSKRITFIHRRSPGKADRPVSVQDTYVGAHGNRRGAPIPAVRGTAIERQGSTHVCNYRLPWPGSMFDDPDWTGELLEAVAGV
jgi:hypothetical protein